MKKLSEKKKMDYFRLLLYFHEHPNCEVCGGKVIDPSHHIVFRSQGGKAEDDNLISLCRWHHDRAHFKGVKPWLFREDFWRIKGLDLAEMEEKFRIARSGCKQK